jgi:hypothetical protein
MNDMQTKADWLGNPQYPLTNLGIDPIANFGVLDNFGQDRKLSALLAHSLCLRRPRDTDLAYRCRRRVAAKLRCQTT